MQSLNGTAAIRGYNWTAIYDGLNRRLSTATVLVTNGVTLNLQPPTINQYYDPQVEFLELGVSYGLQTVWKLYGPDLNGRYGGLNGTGGFDAVSPYLNLFNPVISDFRGNVLAEITNGVVSWIPARPTGYGAVPGYRAVALAYDADMAQSSVWRGRWVDITGYHQIGLRPYDSVSGRWLTYDSVWNARDPNAYTFCGGDPVNGFDSDGRLDQNAPDEMDSWQAADFQYQLYQGNPAAVRAMQQNEGNEAYFNGDATAYLQGQNDRAAEMAAVVLPTISVASVLSLPAGPEGEAITWNVIGGAIIRSATINGAASATIAYETDQPVAPAFAGGFVTGAVTGPAGAYAQTLDPFANVAVNSVFGFGGNYAGSYVNQITSGQYNPNESLSSAILGAILNPAEANVNAGAESFLPQTSLFKAGQATLEYGIDTADTAFQSSVIPQSNNGQESLDASLNFGNQPSSGAYQPGPLGGKH